jgi:hypothetical protein
MRQKPISVTDLMDQLNADPAWRAEQERRDAAREAEMQILRREEKPLIADLSAVGIKVDSVWDLVNTNRAYPAAIPVLARHLQNRKYPIKIREGIIRALIVPEADSTIAYALLHQLWELEPCSGGLNDSLKGAIAVALTFMARKIPISEILRVIENEKFGYTIFPLIEAVAKIMGSKSIPILLPLLDRPSVAGPTARALANLKAIEALPKLRVLSDVPNGNLRAMIRGSIKKLEKLGGNTETGAGD